MPMSLNLEGSFQEVPSERLRDQARLLKELVGVSISQSELRAVWPRLLEHKWFISERLGRDVGLRTAAVDYFENLMSPEELRSGTSRVRRIQIALRSIFPPAAPGYSVGDFERAMRGTRSLAH
jgi:hypothetical protein